MNVFYIRDWLNYGEQFAKVTIENYDLTIITERFIFCEIHILNKFPDTILILVLNSYDYRFTLP